MSNWDLPRFNEIVRQFKAAKTVDELRDVAEFNDWFIEQIKGHDPGMYYTLRETYRERKREIG